MGALIAFELCRWLRAVHNYQPQLLSVAGRGAPEIPDPGLALHAASEAALIVELRRLGGTPEKLLADPARIQSLLRLIRADFAVCEMYSYLPGPPLGCPIVVFGGADDPDWRAEHLEAWRNHTSASCVVRMLPGGHFFIDTARREFLVRLGEYLAR
jgi:medium-chain acyl-[acyl-carrier-protein] hydrolase